MCALLSEGQEIFSLLLVNCSVQQLDVVFILGELTELFDQDGYVDQVRKERLEAS